MDLADPVRLGQPPRQEVNHDGQRKTHGERGHHCSVLRASAEDLAGAETAEEDGSCEVRINAGAGEPIWLVAVGGMSAFCVAARL